MDLLYLDRNKAEAMLQKLALWNPVFDADHDRY